jgi:hypothetical protein
MAKAQPSQAVTERWGEIEVACAAGMTFPDAERHFGVKRDTIRKRAKRHKWVLPHHVMEAVREAARGAVAKTARDWLAKGESHREKMFDIAEQSLKTVKKVKVKTAKDLEIIDKVGRRAAGLENDEGAKLTLIQLNERMEDYDDQPIEKPADAREVESEVTSVEQPGSQAAHTTASAD